MKADVDLFSARVPRYTSYPTTPHFHAGVTQETMRGWLQDLPQGLPLSLYLHVPFCDTLCWFCGCHTTVINRYSPLQSYLEHLHKEIATLGPLVKGHKVTHLHWGGGSPTIMSPDDVRGVKKALDAAFDFAPDAEFAVEIDPRGLKQEMVTALAESGLTRASIGVQDFDEKVQKAINRIQPYEETRDVVNALRAAGLQSLNIDLIYGLPYQTMANVQRTIELALTLKPQRFAVFGYAHVPHFKKHMELIKEETLPGAEDRFEQFELTHRLLSEAGYVPVGLDHFALPSDSLAIAQKDGSLQRNFQGYTSDDAPALIGLGASSISALPQGYVQNKPEVVEWRKAVEAGELPVARGIGLSEDDKLRRSIIEKLMCFLEVDLAAFGKAAGDFPREMEDLAQLIRQGYVVIDGSVLRVPHDARAAVRLVASVFDSYLAKSKAVHAVAV